jgi:hypothetical protein
MPAQYERTARAAGNGQILFVLNLFQNLTKYVALIVQYSADEVLKQVQHDDNYIILAALGNSSLLHPASFRAKKSKSKINTINKKPIPSNLLPHFTVIVLWTLTDYHQHLPPP